jgi:TPR repeat protein
VVLAQARDLLLTTCERGEASACAFAGALARGGEDRNPEKTAELLSGACERGQHRACFDLAELRSEGRPRPEVRDLELYVNACVGGVEAACRKLGPRPATVAVAEFPQSASQ